VVTGVVTGAVERKPPSGGQQTYPPPPAGAPPPALTLLDISSPYLTDDQRKQLHALAEERQQCLDVSREDTQELMTRITKFVA
jgi:hypothetical protein